MRELNQNDCLRVDLCQQQEAEEQYILGIPICLVGLLGHFAAEAVYVAGGAAQGRPEISLPS